MSWGTELRALDPRRSDVGHATPSSAGDGFEPVHKRPSNEHGYEFLDAEDDRSAGMAPSGLFNSSTAVKVRDQHWVSWPVQTLSWLLALAALAAIVSLVAAFDGQHQPNWSHGITLNAVLSILATTCTFSIMVPIAAALGQAKWMWFRGDARSLSEFDAIDQASRGHAGSTVLLFKGIGGPLAMIGAILTILVLAINPFVQQIVRYVQRREPGTGALVPISISYGLSGTGGLTSGYDPTVSQLNSAINYGALEANSSAFLPDPTCPSANCTWPAYYTLALCPACVDLTSLVKVSEPKVYGHTPYTNVSWYTWNYILPNGLILQYQGNPDTGAILGYPPYNISALSLYDGPYSGAKSLAFSNDSLLALDAIAMWMNTTAFIDRPSQATITARECKLQFCMRKHTAQTVSGVFSEIVVEEWTNNTAVADKIWFEDEYDSDQIDYDPTVTINPSGVDASVQVSNSGGRTMANDLNDELETTSIQSQLVSDLVQAIRNSFITQVDGTPVHYPSIDAVFESVAASLTLLMRSSARYNSSSGNLLDYSYAQGVTWTERTVVQVQWPWVVLPLLLQVAVFIYLRVVIAHTKRLEMGPWRNSTLPVLLHGLDPEARRSLGVLNDIDDMEEAVDEMNVRLTNEEGGWRLLPVKRNLGERTKRKFFGWLHF